MSNTFDKLQAAMQKACPKKGNNNAACTKCKLTEGSKGSFSFRCHCGTSVTLQGGRVKGFTDHYASVSCVKTSNAQLSTPSIATMFLKRPQAEPQVVSRNQRIAVPVACTGLNDLNWQRPRAKKEHTILAYVNETIKSSSRMFGHPPRFQLICELWPNQNRKEKDLSKEELLQVQQEEAIRGKWSLDKIFSSVRSVKCLRDTLPSGDTKTAVCLACLSLKKEGSLVAALNRDHATEDTAKYIPKSAFDDILSQKAAKFIEVRQGQQNLEHAAKGGLKDFWGVLAAHGRKGDFDKNEIFIGLILAVAAKMQREQDGKVANASQVSNAFSDFFAVVAAVSPRAADVVRQHLAGASGRHLRFQRMRHCIVFVFRPEHGLCATNNDAISLPTAAFPKVNAFHETVFCTSFEKSLKQKKVANRRGEQDEEI